jgi:hypothetical protein
VVWKHFTKEGNLATCRICLKVIKTSGNTTNLKSHIDKNHPNFDKQAAIPIPAKRNPVPPRALFLTTATRLTAATEVC